MIASAANTAVAVWTATFWVVVHGTVLAAIAWALSATLLRRARPAVIAALWSVVLVKFLVPIGPAMPWSLASVLDRLVGAHAPAARYAVPDDAAPAAAAATPQLSILAMIALVALVAWALTAVVILARRMRAQRLAYREAASAPMAAPALVAVVAAVAGRIGLRRTPDVRTGDGVVPWVTGLRRPILVVPRELSGDALAAVVGHELAHLRRRDAWLRLVQVIAGSLFFFVPVVRWINRRIDASRELACDAWAIARGPLAAPDYARVLVGLVRRAQIVRAAPAGALGLAGAHHLGRRVDALIARRAPRAGVGLAGIALLAAWILVGLSGASRAEARHAAAGTECTFTPTVAAKIMATHPEADQDGDGVLTRTEACDFELEWALLQSELPEGSDVAPLAEGLHAVCNSTLNGDTSASPSIAATPPETCTQE